VLVASFDSVSLRTIGVRLLADLWTIGVSAELAADVETPHQLKRRYESDRHCWTIMIKRSHADDNGDRGLKVKSLLRQDERDTDLRMSDLLSWLRNEIRDRDQQQGLFDARAKGISKSMLGTDSVMVREDNMRRINILPPSLRKTKVNRKNIIQGAELRTTEVVKGIADNPIIAVGMREEILDSIRDIRLADPDSWRRFIQSLPVADRNYVSELHSALFDLSRKTSLPVRYVLIYDYKTTHCICYDLGKPPKVTN
jgi:translation initiation factor 2-alpha kinase 4